jgi:hypothetical protein
MSSGGCRLLFADWSVVELVKSDAGVGRGVARDGGVETGTGRCADAGVAMSVARGTGAWVAMRVARGTGVGVATSVARGGRLAFGVTAGVGWIR